MAPTVRRTWAPRGRTPVLRHAHRHARKCSGIGGLSISPKRRHVGAYLHLYRDADISQEAVVAFLRDLTRHLGGRLTVIWDRWNVHRGPIVREFLARHPGIRIEPLPAYAPELNPVDHQWGYIKGHRMANHGLIDLDALDLMVGDEFNELARDQRLLRSFIRATRLSIRL